MSERRTRRQAARDAASDDTTKDTPDTDMNGHGVAKENGNDHKAKGSSPKENIFLFWPNVIGMVLPMLPMLPILPIPPSLLPSRN